MNPAILQQLREQTRPAHVALEAQPQLKKLLSSRLTVLEYSQLLQAMLAFYRSLEPELVPATAALLERHPDPEYRYLPRAPLLLNDCQALGCVDSGFMPGPGEFRLDGSGAQLLGVLYVLEGSTLGGKLIASHLARTLGLSEGSGASFFHNHQGERSWMAFRRWVGGNSTAVSQEQTINIVAGADMMFSALHSHLDQWQLVPHGE
jgi:heme oxygenase (biliverdin-IX-beta and delta-forming)